MDSDLLDINLHLEGGLVSEDLELPAAIRLEASIEDCFEGFVFLTFKEAAYIEINLSDLRFKWQLFLL